MWNVAFTRYFQIIFKCSSTGKRAQTFSIQFLEHIFSVSQKRSFHLNLHFCTYHFIILSWLEFLISKIFTLNILLNLTNLFCFFLFAIFASGNDFPFSFPCRRNFFKKIFFLSLNRFLRPSTNLTEFSTIEKSVSKTL